MKQCDYLSKEARCAPYTTAYGPQNSTCDQHMDDKCGMFQDLYHGKQTHKSCYKANVGKEYICPQVGKPKGQKKFGCHHQNPNIGVHGLCNSRVVQKGGKDKKKKVDCFRGYCRPSMGPDYFNLAAIGQEGEIIATGINPTTYGLLENLPGSHSLSPPTGILPEESCTPCKIGSDGCPVFDPACKKTYDNNARQFICGDRLRCGNGEIAKEPMCSCQNCQEVVPKIWNQPINESRHYGIEAAEEVPGYYLDLLEPQIGGRPVWSRSNRNAIPDFLLCDQKQLLDKCFGCRQPCWNENCI